MNTKPEYLPAVAPELVSKGSKFGDMSKVEMQCYLTWTESWSQDTLCHLAHLADPWILLSLNWSVQIPGTLIRDEHFLWWKKILQTGQVALSHGYAFISGNFRMVSWPMIPPSHCSGTDLPSFGSVSAIAGWLAEQGKERSHITTLQLESASHQSLTFTGAQREFRFAAASSPYSNLVLQSLLHITDPTHQVSTLLRCISQCKVEAFGNSTQHTSQGQCRAV